MTEPMQVSVLVSMLPELLLAVGAMVLLMVGAFRGDETARALNGVAIALLVAAAVLVARLPAGKLVTFNGSFVIDDFARFLKILALVGSAATIFMSFDYKARQMRQRFEYPVLNLLSTTRLPVLISAADLIPP